MVIVDSASQRMFREAMNMIEDATSVNGKKCIQFVARARETDYTSIGDYNGYVEHASLH